MFLVKNALLVALVLCCLVQVRAEKSKIIEYQGQKGESFNLDMIEKIIRHRTEVQDSTCSRQVPYQDEECHTETTYHEECRNVPGETTCHTEYDRECHTEYEQQCHTEYDRECHTEYDRQCHTEYDRECHTEYDRQCRTEYENVCQNETRYERECRTIPGERRCHVEQERVCRNVTRHREECTQGPVQQRCHQEPARRSCRTLPNGEQRCRDVPGRQICDKIPGERVCRQVAYQEQECSNVPRERCENTPSRQDCRDVPRTERVCHDVPRERCENVPRQACENVPRQACEDIPRQACENVPRQACEEVPRQACEDVPRQECQTSEDQRVCEDVPEHNEVCEDVTRYRDEEYACQKEVDVPYTVKIPVKSVVDLIFEDLTSEGQSEFKLSFELQKSGDIERKLEGQENFVLIEKKEIEIDDQEESRESKIQLSYKVVDKEKILQSIAKPMGEMVLKKKSLKIAEVSKPEMGELQFHLTIKEVLEQEGEDKEQKPEEDKPLFEKEIDASMLKFDEKDQSVTINLSKEKLEMESKKEYEVIVLMSLKVEGALNLKEEELVQKKEEKLEISFSPFYWFPFF